MAWVDIPINRITFRLFEPSPSTATVSVAAADLLLFRYKRFGTDTVTIDFRIGKAFFKPTTAAASGITMELSVPLAASTFRLSAIQARSTIPARRIRMTASSPTTLAASRTLQAAWRY